MSAVVPPPSREPKPGEQCVCGRRAVLVWQLRDREVPWCGVYAKPVTR